MSKTRVNANIDDELYCQAKEILASQNMTVTAFIEQSVKELVKKYSYEQDKAAFDRLAGENATKDFLVVESECVNDGL